MSLIRKQHHPLPSQEGTERETSNVRTICPANRCRKRHTDCHRHSTGLQNLRVRRVKPWQITYRTATTTMEAKVYADSLQGAKTALLFWEEGAEIIDAREGALKP
jgi:hypothetical protein